MAVAPAFAISSAPSGKGKKASDAATAQLASARSELNKWKIADISVRLLTAQEELAALTGANEQLTKALAQELHQMRPERQPSRPTRLARLPQRPCRRHFDGSRSRVSDRAPSR